MALYGFLRLGGDGDDPFIENGVLWRVDVDPRQAIGTVGDDGAIRTKAGVFVAYAHLADGETKASDVQAIRSLLE